MTSDPAPRLFTASHQYKRRQRPKPPTRKPSRCETEKLFMSTTRKRRHRGCPLKIASALASVSLARRQGDIDRQRSAALSLRNRDRRFVNQEERHIQGETCPMSVPVRENGGKDRGTRTFSLFTLAGSRTARSPSVVGGVPTNAQYSGAAAMI